MSHILNGVLVLTPFAFVPLILEIALVALCSKGVLNVKGQPKRVVFQGVQMMFDAAPERFWNASEQRKSQLVFIGRELDEAKIKTGFLDCIAG